MGCKMNPQMMMAMLPMMIQMIQGFGGKGMGGSDAERSSTFGKGAQGALEQVQNQVKGMQGAGDITQNQNYMQGQDWLQSLFNDPSFFNKFEAPLQRQFQEETIPALNARYAGMGSGGAQGSTSMLRNLGREGSRLHEAIAALRGNMQQTGANQALQYAQQPFSNYQQLLQQAITPTENVYQPASTGLWGALPGLVSGVAQGFGQNWGQQMAPGSPTGGVPGGGLPTNVSLSRTYARTIKRFNHGICFTEPKNSL